MARASILFSLALFAAAAAGAQPAPSSLQAVRGVVSAVDPSHLTIQPKVGAPLTIDLTPTWSVQVTKAIDVAEIREGSFIGTAEIPQSDGVGQSLEVHVFPPGVKIGEGHYAWTLAQGSMMTNGTVGTVTSGSRGRELQVSYPGGQRKIIVPPGVPVVRITNGERAMIAPGAAVFLMAFPKPGGGLIAGAVAVGENGAAPPM